MITSCPPNDMASLDSIKPCGQCPVRTYGICSVVGQEHFARLASLVTILELSRKTVFVREQESADHVYVLLRGAAKLYKMLSDGRRQTLGFVYPGDVLGLAAGDGYCFSAETLEPVRLCRLPKTKLKSLARQVDGMDERLFECVVGDLVGAHEQVLLLGRKTAPERLASFLHRRSLQARPTRTRLCLPMSRGDIADFLGMTIETVSRAFAQLRRQGIVDTPNLHEVIILLPAELEALAQGGAPRRVESPSRDFAEINE